MRNLASDLLDKTLKNEYITGSLRRGNHSVFGQPSAWRSSQSCSWPSPPPPLGSCPRSLICILVTGPQFLPLRVASQVRINLYRN